VTDLNKYWLRLWKYSDSIFTFIVTIFLPVGAIIFFCVIEADKYTPQNSGVSFFVIFGVYGLGICIISLINFIFFKESHEQLWSHVDFMFRHANRALLFGGGIGCVFAAGYVAFPSTDDFAVRYRGALGVYFATIGVVLGLNAFYKRV
jgi:hypothetical protein